jgi:hypothetical protein
VVRSGLPSGACLGLEGGCWAIDCDEKLGRSSPLELMDAGTDTHRSIYDRDTQTPNSSTGSESIHSIIPLHRHLLIQEDSKSCPSSSLGDVTQASSYNSSHPHSPTTHSPRRHHCFHHLHILPYQIAPIPRERLHNSIPKR